MSNFGTIRMGQVLQSALLVGTAAGAFCNPSAALAQAGGEVPTKVEQKNTQPQSVAASTPDPVAGGIVVTGIRASLESAVSQKRNADVIIDGISADDIGNIPDLDLGEALVRIPGVQIDRDAERRGSSISVRGLPASFTKTTVMGQNIASPSAARFRVNPFGAFDSSIFSGANVIKSFTPDIQSGGLGANVDLRISPALSRKDGQLIVRAELGYEDLSQEFNPGLFAAGSKHFADGRFGLFGTVAWSQQGFRRDIVTINRYDNLIPASGTYTNAANPALQTQIRSLDPNASTANDYAVLVPTQFRQFTEISNGDRISAAAGFEWEVSDSLSFRTNAIFTRRKLSDNLLDVVEVNLTAANSIATPLGDPILAGSFDAISSDADLESVYYFPHIQFSNPNYQPGNRSFNFLEQTFGIYPELEYKDDKWKIQAIGTYSEARNTFVQEQFLLKALNLGGAGNGITGELNTGNGDISDYLLSLNIPSNAFAFTGFPTTTLGGNGSFARFNSNRNEVQLTANNQSVDRSLWSAELNVERFLNFGPLTAVKFGGRYQKDDAVNLRQFNSLLGTKVENLDASIIRPNATLTSGDTFFGGTAPGYLVDGFTSLDLARIKELILPIDPARLPVGAAPNFLSDWYQQMPLTSAAAFNWDSSRKNIEAYAMAKFNLEDLIGIRARGNFGARYTKTDIKGNVREVVDGAGNIVLAAAPETSVRYSGWLPSANLIVDLTDSLVLNAAYYKTFEALDLVEFSPSPTSYSGLDLDGSPGIDGVRLNVSQLDRKPRRSESFDLGLTWYNRKGSLIAVNLFHKRVSSNYELTSVCPGIDVNAKLPTDVTFTGLTRDTSNNCITGANVSLLLGGTQTVLPAGSTIEVLQNVPTANKLTLKGVEAQIQQNLSFLEGWVSGFGFQANYSYVDPSEKVYGVSRYTYNLIGYYETKDFSVRLARNTRAKNYLPAGGGFQGGERQVKGRSQLDLSIRVTPVKNLDFRFEAFNLTNVLRDEYEFVPELMRRTDYDGRVFNFSVQKKF